MQKNKIKNNSVIPLYFASLLFACYLGAAWLIIILSILLVLTILNKEIKKNKNIETVNVKQTTAIYLISILFSIQFNIHILIVVFSILLLLTIIFRFYKNISKT